MEWSEGGGKWDNCNSIINKYIKKYLLEEANTYNGLKTVYSINGFGKIGQIHAENKNSKIKIL